MTGKILVVDVLATNRIVLNVRLTAAFYKVYQATGGEDAVEVATRIRPDLLLVGGDLPDMTVAALIAALKRAVDAPPPVVVLVPQGNTEKRVAALEAGAADVISKPFEESHILARLRSIMRQRNLDADLGMRAETARALGFAEEPAAFSGPACVAIHADSKDRAIELRNRLGPVLGHDIAAFGHDPPEAITDLARAPDVILINIGANRTDAALRLLAELQASPRTRRARLVAVLDRAVAHLVAPVLDMGANDAVTGPVDDRELALRLSNQLAHKKRDDAMRNRLENSLQAAVIDPLTGLYNRRYAMNFVKRMSAEAAEAGRTFAIMVADLDHFKAVNDTFGHAAGDAVLAHVSNRMSSALSRDDMIARIGGEEFLIAMPDTSMAGARGLADRLCRLVRESPVCLPDGSGPIHVTVSIGVTMASPQPGAAQADAEALMREADRALYDAKAGGRNTVTFCMRSAA